MVRVGLSYYGMVDPAVLALREAAEAASRLHPALALKARAVRIEHVSPGERVGYGATWEARRASQIATLPVGYGDGYARAWSPGACALVRGTRVPLVGAVSMDSLTVDVTDVPGCDPGEEFVLLGSQGGDCVTADELATIRRTISYEVTTGFGSRLPRIYRDGPEIAALLDASNRLTFASQAAGRWQPGTP
jgi:alanine racemase